MEFEYNSDKSMLNQRKHGLSFEEVVKLWEMPGVEIEAKTVNEARRMLIAPYKGKLYSCIFTIRREKIRLVSARRSHSREEKIYHEKIS